MVNLDLVPLVLQVLQLGHVSPLEVQHLVNKAVLEGAQGLLEGCLQDGEVTQYSLLDVALRKGWSSLEVSREVEVLLCVLHLSAVLSSFTGSSPASVSPSDACSVVMVRLTRGVTRSMAVSVGVSLCLSVSSVLQLVLAVGAPLRWAAIGVAVVVMAMACWRSTSESHLQVCVRLVQSWSCVLKSVSLWVVVVMGMCMAASCSWSVEGRIVASNHRVGLSRPSLYLFQLLDEVTRGRSVSLVRHPSS